MDKVNLVMDAVYRARESNHVLENDYFMKEVLYGYSNTEKNITGNLDRIKYVSQKIIERTLGKWDYINNMSEMQEKAKTDSFPKQ